ncbi:hypothetical protein [Archangium violaceum]|nr:hypothetical protein [Archangium violaceum]
MNGRVAAPKTTRHLQELEQILSAREVRPGAVLTPAFGASSVIGC